MEANTTEVKLHIFLRNLVRDRTSGSVLEYKNLGGSEHICTLLRVDKTKGISESDAIVRRAEYGSNDPPLPEMTTYFGFLFDAFSDFTVIMLCCAAIVSLVLAFAYEKTAGSYAEGFAILVSVLLVTNVAAVNDYRKQAQFMRLNAAVDDVSVRAVRDGAVCDVRSAELVCGDIVQINVGDILTVDGVLLESSGVSTDESALTGEPVLIRKNEETAPFLLSGTKVMEGSGQFIVVAVGDNSEAGQIRCLIRDAKKKPSPRGVLADEETLDREETASTEKSVLTAKLDRIAIQVGKIATIVAIVALLVMCIRYAVVTFALSNPDTLCAQVTDELCSSQAVWDYASDPSVGFPSCDTAGHSLPCCSDTADGAEILGAPCPWMKNHLGEFLSFLITAITILVVAVPEGLPLAVTLSLAFSVQKMQADHNLVKHLDACETMGSATMICSDKTGTLTKNRMTVVKSMFGIDRAARPDERISKMCAEAVALIGNADIKYNPQIKLWDQIGSKTECALLQFGFESFGTEYMQIRSQAKFLKKFPFSSSAKKSAVLVEVGGINRMYIVGASEIVLAQCSSFVGGDGDCLFTEGTRLLVEKTIEEWASLAMRTVVVAYRDLPPQINVESIDENVTGCVLLTLVGIEDPLRDEVFGAIEKCNSAGVDVKMVTGDNLITAVAIARSCNIIRSSDCLPNGELRKFVAMTGPQFREFITDKVSGGILQAEFDKIWPHLRVLARSSPTDKYVLVSGIIDSPVLIGATGDRQVVAVTGDGTNDAPALKKADVGFAMGITGTAVARDAADIILLDDNFSSIVKACMWGRNVYDSIAKFLQFQLTVNVVAVVIAIEGAFINNESPIGAVQMLWVNLIMDALASLALATETPTEALLLRKPHGRHQSAISSIMIWNISGQAMYQLVVLNLIFFCGPDWFGYESGVGKGHDAPPSEHYTMMFNVLVVMQLTNQINSRKLYHEMNVFRGLFLNHIFVSILAMEAILQVIFVQFGGKWVNTFSLSGWIWAICIGFSVGSFPVQLLIIYARKAWMKRRARVVPPTENVPLEDMKVSVLGPLPRDPESLRFTQSAQNLGTLTKQGSGTSLRAFSTRNLKDLVTAPQEGELLQTVSGGFKNKRRQITTNSQFRKLNSFSDAAGKAHFTQAAKEYQKDH